MTKVSAREKTVAARPRVITELCSADSSVLQARFKSSHPKKTSKGSPTRQSPRRERHKTVLPTTGLVGRSVEATPKRDITSLNSRSYEDLYFQTHASLESPAKDDQHIHYPKTLPTRHRMEYARSPLGQSLSRSQETERASSSANLGTNGNQRLQDCLL